jgi:hypothetical protein
MKIQESRYSYLYYSGRHVDRKGIHGSIRETMKRHGDAEWTISRYGVGRWTMVHKGSIAMWSGRHSEVDEATGKTMRTKEIHSYIL